MLLKGCLVDCYKSGLSALSVKHSAGDAREHMMRHVMRKPMVYKHGSEKLNNVNWYNNNNKRRYACILNLRATEFE